MIGPTLLVVGFALLVLCGVVNALSDWPADGGVRATGRLVLRVLGPLTRPLRRAGRSQPPAARERWPTLTAELDARVAREVARLRAEPRTINLRCARYGHRPDLTDPRRTCRRCRVPLGPGHHPNWRTGP